MPSRIHLSSAPVDLRKFSKFDDGKYVFAPIFQLKILEKKQYPRSSLIVRVTQFPECLSFYQNVTCYK